jgi:hypothetical protein
VSAGPFVIDTPDDFTPDDLFVEGRDQVLVAVRITPVFAQLDLSLLAAVVEEANLRGLSLVRESPLRDEHLLCVFEAYDDGDDEVLTG